MSLQEFKWGAHVSCSARKWSCTSPAKKQLPGHCGLGRLALQGQAPSPQVPASQPRRGVLCSPGAAGSQVMVRTLLNTPKSLESMKLCSVALAVASSHPFRVCSQQLWGEWCLCPQQTGHSHLSHHQQHLAGQDRKSFQSRPFNPPPPCLLFFLSIHQIFTSFGF